VALSQANRGVGSADGGGQAVHCADSVALKDIVDEPGRPVAQTLFPAFLVLAHALPRFLGDALNEAHDAVFSIVTQRTVAAFAERTFAHLHRMSARFHTRRETGAIVRDV
jgi:ATP-binding cassette subfamily B protein